MEDHITPYWGRGVTIIRVHNGAPEEPMMYLVRTLRNIEFWSTGEGGRSAGTITVPALSLMYVEAVSPEAAIERLGGDRWARTVPSLFSTGARYMYCKHSNISVREPAGTSR